MIVVEVGDQVYISAKIRSTLDWAQLPVDKETFQVLHVLLDGKGKVTAIMISLPYPGQPDGQLEKASTKVPAGEFSLDPMDSSAQNDILPLKKGDKVHLTEKGRAALAKWKIPKNVKTFEVVHIFSEGRIDISVPYLKAPFIVVEIHEDWYQRPIRQQALGI